MRHVADGLPGRDLSPARSEKEKRRMLGETALRLLAWWSCPAAGQRGCGSGSARRGDGHADPRGDVHGRANWGRSSRRSHGISVSSPRTCAAMATGSAHSRFRLEDCADDIAALAGVLGIGRFAAVGYSMGGMVAQLLYRRHAPLLSGLVFCSTARNARGSPAEQMAARGAGDDRRPTMEPDAAPDGRRGFRHGAAGPH